MMTTSRSPWSPLAAVAVVLASACWGLSDARAQAAPEGIANNGAIFIDGHSFRVLTGKGRGDVAAQIKHLGARELGPGAIVFRSGDKLYIVDGSAALLASANAAEDQGPIRIEYETPKAEGLKEIYEIVKERRALEMIRQILSPLKLPEDLYIKTVECNGIPNAYFFREGDRPVIRICYEYLQELRQNMPKETTPEGITPHEAIIGQLLFAALHETGHAAFDIFNIPIFGRQEDAADQFATYIMLQFGGEKAHRLIRGAAYSYLGFIKALKDKPKVTLPLAAFSSDHGAPEQRFYNLACTAYGYDPKTFAAVVDKDYLPEARAKVCKYEYSNLRYAFRKLISPHIDQELARKVLATTWLTSPEAEK